MAIKERLKNYNILFYLSVLSAFFLRLYFVLKTNEVLNADESLIMIISKHIAEFKDFPVFHYGNSYLGTLDNYISVIFVKIFGLNVISLRLTPIFLSLIFIFTTKKLVEIILNKKGAIISAFYIAFPPIFLLMWNIRMFIGYIDILILGDILYLILLKLIINYESLNSKQRIIKFSFLGFISGLGMWCHFLFIVYILTAIIFFVISYFNKKDIVNLISIKNIAGFIFFALIGFSPVLFFNIQHFGKSSGFIKHQAIMYSNFMNNLAIGVYNFVFSDSLTLFGFSPPWNTFRINFKIGLHKPIIIIIQSFLVFIISIMLFLLFKKKKYKWISYLFLTTSFLSLLTIVLLIYGYNWNKIIYPQRLFIPKLSLNFMFYEITNPRLLLFLIFILPIIFIYFKEQKRIYRIFINFTDSYKKSGIILFLIHIIVLFSLFLFSSRAVERSPRYLFPLYSFIPFFVAILFTGLEKHSKKLSIIFITFLLSINLIIDFSVKPINMYKPLHYINIAKTPDSYKKVINELLSKKIYNIYSPYWQGFPIVFNSGEKIIAVDKGSRIPEYLKRVNHAKKVAFVFFKSHAIYYKRFERILENNNFFFKRDKIGGFIIYYDINILKLRKSPVWRKIIFILGLP